jgi:hypothetical protein
VIALIRDPRLPPGADCRHGRLADTAIRHEKEGALNRWFRTALLAAAAAGTFVTAAAQQPVPGQADLKVGDAAPDFTLQASDGQTYTLSKLRGKTVVLAWFPKAFTAG